MSVIKYVNGDLFNDYDKSKKTILAHGCNSHGVMGSGVAKTFKYLYPAAFIKYNKEVTSDEYHKVGYTSYHIHKYNLILASCVTQLDYGKDGKKYISYDAIYTVFRDLINTAKSTESKQIVFPLIGAGLGGGDWRAISVIINQAFNSINDPKPELICFIPDEATYKRITNASNT